MDINVTVSFVLPPSLERFFSTLSTALVAGALTSAVDAAPAAEGATGDAAPAKRGPGRPRKSAEANGATPPAAAQEPAPPAAPAPAPASTGKKLTVTEVGLVVQEVMGKIGVPAVRSVFAKFNAKKVLDIPEDQLPALVEALREAEGMAS